MRQPRLRTVLVGTGAAIALVAGSTTAYAAIAGPVDSSGVIHGCYTDKAINGTHVFVLQDAGTNCPKGTTAISWNQQGAAGPAGPAGATGSTGAQGPAGPAGAAGPAGPAGPPGAMGPAGPAGPAGGSSLDALSGTTCNAGSPGQGALSVSYGSQGSVTITCVPAQLYTLTVSVAAGDGNDSIVSSPAGINCGPNVANSVCSAQFPAGYTVTLTGQADFADVLDGWSGGGCPAHVNITHPYNDGGQPGLASPLDNTCAVTVSADTTVSASFAGVMKVLEETTSDLVNFVPDQGGAECPTSQPDCKGTNMQPATGITDVIPYGTTVKVIDDQGNGATFEGTACTAAAGATITATECDFTMIPGDTLGLDFPSLTISGP
jgi:hypothetical protein